MTPPAPLPNDTAAEREAHWMARALALAVSARDTCPPNPAVGCLIVSAGGDLLAEGCTQVTGQAHAEVVALQAARAAGARLQGATVYVTLEPCAHHGRTPPCADALVQAGVGRVVVAVQDPNPLVAGRGIARLRAAGVVVDVGLMGEEARELNLGFFSRMVRGTPWVRLKIAASLDGRTALPDGRSQWITAAPARTDGHAWRARAGAILTGIGTVREDDPRLDVRLVETTRQPARVVVDARLETPADARIVPGPGPVWIYAAQDNPARRADLEAAGATVTLLPGVGGKVDLAAMLKHLSAREVNEVHVEAGHKLNGSLVREGLVDECLVYLAPRLIGAGREMAAFGPLDTLDQARALTFTDITRIGDDLRIVARVTGRDRF